MIKSKTTKRILWLFLLGILLMNLVAGFHAYKFTHFANAHVKKTLHPEQLSFTQKLNALIFGVDNPRPVNKQQPIQPYQTINLQSNKKIELWSINTPDAKGTVILFNGYSASKSQMLDKSDEFIKMGYSTLMVDFMGTGGSEGHQTTLGFKEAEEVKDCFDYLKAQGEEKIYLFGTSMGACAILKAVDDYQLSPAAIIVECPFGSMYKTVCARFNTMNVPTFPMAGLLVFWGGAENGFWAFGHNPIEYAKGVHCPTLLLYGEKDKSVSREETDEIFKNLAGKKQFKTYLKAGHENYLTQYKEEWVKDVQEFLSSY